MRMVVCWSLAVAQVASVPGSAAAQVVPVVNEDERIICKSQKKPASRLVRRRCATRAQWDKMSEQQKRDYSEVRDRPQIEIGR